jgi:tRNA 5-methylaminomethyl-2-thiouridine biosynthesis bifunctional protein
MPEPIEWLDDGTPSGAPFNPRFGDRYRSELGGLEQARKVFLAGCGLPAAWSGQPQWRVLETGFGLGLNFLVTWDAWKADPLRPKLLHFVSVDAFPASAEDVLRSAADHGELHPLALQLQAQLWGLLPGFHRLVFEGGHVLLTLCIGDAKAMLRQHQFEADSVYLDGFSPSKNPDIWDVHTLKAVARCCRRGTRIATWTIARSVLDALSQCGFVCHKTPGTPPKRDNLQGQYNPSWEPKKSVRSQRSPDPPFTPRRPTTAIVIGAGLAGAAIANSLARRGWQVVVLDAASTPASGASGLPAGLLVPHSSSDDSLLSRLSRSGVRMTLQQATSLLEHGTDWNHSGVLTHDVDNSHGGASAMLQPSAGAAAEWSHTATPAQLLGAALAITSHALWHAPAGWIKPARLVNAWLGAPGVAWRANARAATLLPSPQGWQVMDADGTVLAQAELVVLAAAYGSQALAASVNPALLDLHPIRGQVSWGVQEANQQGQDQSQVKELPNFPVNGHGGLIPAVPGPEGLRWFMGASYERGCDTPAIKQQDHDQNLERLRRLLPQAADLLANEFKTGTVQAWAGIRCATPGRLPTQGCIATTSSGAEVWICSGMGSRGLTFAGLCAELMAAHLHGEPLPVERRLAQALMTVLPVASHP